MKHLFFLLFFFILVGAGKSALSQSKPCSVLFAERLKINDPDYVFKQIAALSGCGVDSFDLKIFNTPTVVGAFLVNWLNTKKDTAPTVGDFYNTYKLMLESKEYKDIKRGNYNTALPDDDLTLTDKSKMYSNTSINLAKYKTTYSAYCDTSQIVATTYNIIAFTSYREGVKCVQKIAKNALIYFTSKYSVNSRKMEKDIFNNAEVHQLIDSGFVFIELNCDESKNALIEENKYKADSQPYFVTIKCDGWVIAKQESTKDINEFKNFLKRSL